MSKSHNYLYHTVDYRKGRMVCLVRAGFRCERCGCDNFKLLTAHHIKPVSEGGSHQPDNLVCLCTPCHALLHWTEQIERRAQQAEEHAAGCLQAAMELLAA